MKGKKKPTVRERRLRKIAETTVAVELTFDRPQATAFATLDHYLGAGTAERLINAILEEAFAKPEQRKARRV